jgi:hypothetical protein
VPRLRQWQDGAIYVQADTQNKMELIRRSWTNKRIRKPLMTSNQQRRNGIRSKCERDSQAWPTCFSDEIMILLKNCAKHRLDIVRAKQNARHEKERCIKTFSSGSIGVDGIRCGYSLEQD